MGQAPRGRDGAIGVISHVLAAVDWGVSVGVITVVQDRKVAEQI